MYGHDICVITLVLLGSALPSVAGERPPGPPVRLTPSEVILPVDDDALDRQYRALSAMPSVKVTYSALGLVRHIEGDTGTVLSSRARALLPGESAPEVLEKFRDVLLASGKETLRTELNRASGGGRTRFIRLDQLIGGIPVLHGGVSLNVEEATGIVRSMGAFFLPDRGLPREPKLTAAKASALAVQMLETRRIAKPGTVEVSNAPTLAYHGIFPDSTRGRLVWAVAAFYVSADNGDPSDGVYWIDAIDGEYIGMEPYSVSALNRTVYTANNGAPDPNNFPSGLVILFGEGGSSSDQIAMNAYNNAEKTHIAYDFMFGWNADPLGLVMHYNTGDPNAVFSRRNGVDYLRFSDGNASRIPYGNSLDVVAHEFGHAVTWKLTTITPGPDPLSDAQSAAIDEGLGDVSAINVDAYHRPGIVTATWIIGEVFTSDPSRGLRSAADPHSIDGLSRDWFPARLLGPYHVTRHYNSTIISHAYKLLVTGGFHVRAGQPVGGNYVGQIPSLFVPALGKDKAAQIFFEALHNTTMRNFPTFPIMKAAAEAAATELYGEFERDAVDRAFRAVGVGDQCSAPPPPPVLNVEDFCRSWRLWWDPVVGATSYHGQRKPGGWTWANAFTIVDGNFETCSQQVSSVTFARLRACNGCGCSGWSNEVTMYYYSQCP